MPESSHPDENGSPNRLCGRARRPVVPVALGRLLEVRMNRQRVMAGLEHNPPTFEKRAEVSPNHNTERMSEWRRRLLNESRQTAYQS